MTSNKEQNIPNQQENIEKNEKQEKKKESPSPNNSCLVDPRDERIAELEMFLIQAQDRERDNILRTKASIENMRRRNEQDIEKAHKFALENFASELLPVIDNLERALDISNKTNCEFPSTIEGIKLTLKTLMNVIHKFGINVICDINIPFNPEIHQAMTLLESDEHKPNYVMTVMQKGYTLNGRLIRPAMVTVSKVKTNI